LSQFNQPVDRFFAHVLVMAEDPELRKARLALLIRLRRYVLVSFGDISELAAEDGKSG
jgi:glycyl-tRNA synthetase beta subunit